MPCRCVLPPIGRTMTTCRLRSLHTAWLRPLLGVAKASTMQEPDQTQHMLYSAVVCKQTGTHLSPQHSVLCMCKRHHGAYHTAHMAPSWQLQACQHSSMTAPSPAWHDVMLFLIPTKAVCAGLSKTQLCRKSSSCQGLPVHSLHTAVPQGAHVPPPDTLTQSHVSLL